MIKDSKQAGGTLIGVIIGLIVGLGIAVVVAVVITKTPVPFLNKSGKTEKAAELTPGQVADPNKPMYGKQDAIKEAAKEFLKEAGVAAPGETTPVALTVNKTDAATWKEPDAAAAKADDKIAAIKPDTAEDKWIYYLQAGAFREQSDAESTRAKLALQGFEASISEKTSDNGPLYRVRLGPFNQLDTMNRVRGKLSDSGMDVAVVRTAK